MSNQPKPLPNVSLCTHPVVMHKVTLLRNKDTTNKLFRELMREITSYLGYEATRDLSTKTVKIQTPVCEADGYKLDTKVALIPILRGALGMVEPMLDIIPSADVHHIGMYRNKESLLPIMYYNKLPNDPSTEVAVVLEPLIATGGTVSAVLDILRNWGVKTIKVVAVIASRRGLKSLAKAHPDVVVTCAAVDEMLNDFGMVIPGLGDVGDRQFTGEVEEQVTVLETN
eukprot:snap_masked-scaffold_6-processed-gene-19.25-mRNA-1 protein AED:0.11 eAED:0.13 QI:0/-1/0/1/-1/1/1/0/226